VYQLQSRRRPEGNALIYYGMRNRESLFRDSVRLSARQAAVIGSLPRELSRQILLSS